ncbi:MAG TPA: penicillin-binding protein 2 [Gaiellaceae bacterium]
MAPKAVNRRIRLLLAVFALAFAGTLVRAVWLQGVRAASLSKLATSQHVATTTIPAGRGTIFDRNGEPLAIGEQATTIYADPTQIRHPRAVAIAAARVLHLSSDTLYPQLSDRSKSFVYVERKADPARAAALERKGLTGLHFYPEERRSYPQGTVAAQALGFAGVDNRGLAGLEFALDRDLAGKPGAETMITDPAGRAIDVVRERPAVQGRDVYLTLDGTLQSNAEQVLRETVSKWGARSGTAVVLDPRNGNVLAMATQPGFDGNRFADAPRELQRNRAVTDTYEPGSTFKLVTVAGALSEGLVTPDTSFTLPYSLQIADRVVHDAEPRGTELMTVSQILSHSSNIGAITIAREKLGSARLADWISRFGFGHKTGIGFPDESGGIVLPLDRWSGSTIGNVPIGQGIAVTPIQMAAAYAAIANRGLWVQPHIVDHVTGRGRPTLRHKRIVAPSIAQSLVTMLEGVVAEGGTGTLAAIDGYQVAGKTGTAQKPGPNGYTTGKYVASFVGFVPASAPKLVVLVTIDEPKGAIFGGVVAAPAFQAIARFGLQYLEVPPDARR